LSHATGARGITTGVMGWGISAALRTDVIAPGLGYSATLPDASVMLVDGPAMTRSGAVGTRPATAIVRAILTAAPASVTEIVVLFDCPAKVPAARAAVHVRRASAASVMFTVPQLEAMTIKSLGGATWQQLFSTTAGKARAYELLHEALRVETITAAATVAGAPVRTTITSPATSEVWSHPFDGTRSAMAADIEAHAYGEAECQLAMCVRGLSARSPDTRAVILTIDTDIYLQTALTPAIDASQVVIAAARVWRNDHTVVRLSSAGRKRARAEQLTQMWELVACDALAPIATAGGLFFHLCAGGVDYCNGLGGYGWSQPALVAAVAAMDAAPFSESATGWSLDIAALAAALKPARKTRRREDDVGQLCIELDNIVYCWRYYMWQDARKPDVAGPVVECIFQSHDAKTVTDWLAVARGTAELADRCPVEPVTA